MSQTGAWHGPLHPACRDNVMCTLLSSAVTCHLLRGNPCPGPGGVSAWPTWKASGLKNRAGMHLPSELLSTQWRPELCRTPFSPLARRGSPRTDDLLWLHSKPRPEIVFHMHSKPDPFSSSFPKAPHGQMSLINHVQTLYTRHP